MKFRFEHIGPMDAADLELGDLTIIAGRNNTGKTYLVYTMYGFLRTWASDWRRPLADKVLRELADFLRAGIGNRISVDRQAISRLRPRTIEHAALEFSKMSRISQIFSSPPSTFHDARLSVELDADLPSHGECFTLSGVDDLRVKAQYGPEKVDLEILSRAHSPITLRAVTALAMNVALADVPKPFILSAERFGIALFYKELDFAKSRLVEMLQQMDDQQLRASRSPYLIVDRGR